MDQTLTKKKYLKLKIRRIWPFNFKAMEEKTRLNNQWKQEKKEWWNIIWRKWNYGMGRIICCNKIDQHNNNNITYNSKTKNKWIVSKSPQILCGYAYESFYNHKLGTKN
jgi:hypothetical protein